MDGAVNSPFRYAGGKFYARKLIIEHVPVHDMYIEPLAGGASIFFAKNKVTKNWLNDIDKLLINCLTIIRDRPQELINKLRGEEATKERHRYYKHEYKPRDDLELAVRWFYLNRTSYSGIMNMQNCYWGYGRKFSMTPENWPNTILRSSKKLQGVRLTSLDFAGVIEQVEEGAFLFIDPPYFNADQDKFYAHSFKREDHVRLHDVLKKRAGSIKFLLTYDDCKDIRDMYGWAEEIHSKEWFYTINRTDDQTKAGKEKNGNGLKEKRARYKGQELFILNYQSVTQPKLNSVSNPQLTLPIIYKTLK
jgi:DNA adenine methylase